MRLPIHKQGVDKGSTKDAAAFTARRPRRRSGASRSEEYLDKADAWPLNPNGELLLGVKLEDKYALANAEENLKVPGIGFAEWGPGDMALSLGVRGPGNVAETDPQMLAARAKVFAACKANKIFFLNSMNAEQRDRHDQGRRDGGPGEPARRRDRAEVHEAKDALVTGASGDINDQSQRVAIRTARARSSTWRTT